MPKKVLRKRHIAKTISWRIVGTIDTILISWLLTGNPFEGLQMGVGDTVSKMLLYYLHERVWVHVDLRKNPEFQESRKRHIAKSISWRVVGTIDTVLLAWLILGDPWVGLQIGLVEVVTKMVFYYFHERVWHKSEYGIEYEPTVEENE